MRFRNIGLTGAPPQLSLIVNATELRTALWRCDFGAELPQLAVYGHSKCDSKFAFPGMTEASRSKQYAKERHTYVAYWHLPSGDLVSVG